MCSSSPYNLYPQSCQFRRLAEASREGEREGASQSNEESGDPYSKGRLRPVWILELYRSRIYDSSCGKECQQHLLGKLVGVSRWEFIAIPYLGEGDGQPKFRASHPNAPKVTLVPPESRQGLKANHYRHFCGIFHFILILHGNFGFCSLVIHSSHKYLLNTY